MTAYRCFGNLIKFWNCGLYTLNRLREDCSRYPSNIFHLVYLKKGFCRVVQGGRESFLQSGDSFILYTATPAVFQSFSTTEAISFSCSEEHLSQWLPYPQDATAISFVNHSVWGRALSAFLGNLSPECLDHPLFQQRAFCDQLHFLLGLASEQNQMPTGSYRQALLRRFRQCLREHLHEHGFCPDRMVKEQNVTKRVLFATFAEAGSSFGKELFVLRMEKARNLLDDPRYNKKSISEIGGLVGYKYPGHFITAFRKAFGVTPSLYRKTRKL